MDASASLIEPLRKDTRERERERETCIKTKCVHTTTWLGNGVFHLTLVAAMLTRTRLKAMLRFFIHETDMLFHERNLSDVALQHGYDFICGSEYPTPTMLELSRRDFWGYRPKRAQTFLCRDFWGYRPKRAQC
jgi:hypothetical protein